MKKVTSILIKTTVWIFAIAAVLVTVAVASWANLKKPVDSVQNERIVKVQVPEGTPVKLIAQKLKKERLIRNENAFYFAVRFNLFNKKVPFTLKSGTYNLKSSMSMEQIYNELQSGSQEYISVSIAEGLTISKTAKIFEENGVCSAQDFINACKSEKLIAEYEIPAATLEGYLFPDTYFFTPDMDAEAVVRKLADTFFEKIKEIPQLNEKSPEEIFDIVRLASVIEREYRVKEEAPLIASVFSNRLKHGIGLYSCATIEYIITEIQGKPHPEKITYKDLETDSPYNTYRWAGLPEGPISNPGIVALKAAANPPKTNYYYFVLTDTQKGTHTFSSNFDQHKAADSAASYKSKKSKK